MTEQVRLIETLIHRLPAQMSDRDLAVGFAGLTRDEVATLIDCAIKIEQARTGDVLTPTEYGNRFSGLDLIPAAPTGLR